jgi:predicted transposase YbfD/YdcC
MATRVLGQVDLNGKVVTADALHAVKATAEFICDHGGEFVLPVKENRRVLFNALDALPWDQVPVAYAETDRGQGRVTTRTIQVMPAPENLPFPHVSQEEPGRWNCRSQRLLCHGRSEASHQRRSTLSRARTAAAVHQRLIDSRGASSQRARASMAVACGAGRHVRTVQLLLGEEHIRVVTTVREQEVGQVVAVIAPREVVV